MKKYKKEFYDAYPFVDKTLERAAWHVIEQEYGYFKSWNKMARYEARMFFTAIGPMNLKTLSLSSLKCAIKQFGPEDRLHRHVFRLLAQIKSLYNGDDVKAFHRLMPILMSSGRAYRILFSDEVKSFNDIVYITYYHQHFYYIVKGKNIFLRNVLARYFTTNDWTSSDKPTRESLDSFTQLINAVTSDTVINDASAFSQSLFFDLMDVAVPFHKDELVRQVIWFYRYGIEHEYFDLTGTLIITPTLLHKKETVTFFLNDYVCREKTYLFRRRESTDLSLVTINIDNIYLRTAYGRLLASKKISMEEYCHCKNTLSESLGNYAESVGSVHRPFCIKTLMRQIAFYRHLYHDKRLTYAVSFIKALYISINDSNNGAFFANATNFTYSLLVSNRLVKYFEEGYSFIRYSPFDDIKNERKVVFVIYGSNKTTKNLLREDYIAVDFTMIPNSFYRNLAWKAITSSQRRLYRKGFRLTLKHLLPELLKAKRLKLTMTPKIDEISVWDAMFVASFFEQRSNSVTTYNNWMMNVRDFLKWADSSKRMKVEPAAFYFLSGKRTNTIPSNTPILSDREMIKLSDYFAGQATKNPIYGQALILLHLIAITPIRIGHACSLLREEVVFDDRLKTIIIRSANKASNGSITDIVLGEYAKRLITKALDINYAIGLECTQEDLRDQLFVYRSNQKFAVFTTRKFSQMLEKACYECGIPKYTSKNLRATYMTRAYIEASESGIVNDYLLKLFSYHKKAGTTLEHYVNHSEALASLTEFLKKGGDWQKTIYPDEREALKMVIEEYLELIDEAETETAKEQLRLELREYEKKLENIS